MGYTLVTFHAHPDDEAIATGGTMARAKDEGTPRRARARHPRRAGRVRARRARTGREPHRAARRGAAGRGRRSSASTGSSSSATAIREWRARRRTTTTVRSRAPMSKKPRPGSPISCARKSADVLTVYDDHGGYGHPDHVQVHRVGVRAAELAGTRRVYESTMNRDHIRRLMEQRSELMPDTPDAPDAAQMDDFGSPGVDHHHNASTSPSSSTASGRRWPRTRVRSRPTRSSWRCRPRRSGWRSARSGSSAATRRDSRETWLFDDL